MIAVITSYTIDPNFQLVDTDLKNGMIVNILNSVHDDGTTTTTGVSSAYYNYYFIVLAIASFFGSKIFE